MRLVKELIKHINTASRTGQDPPGRRLVTRKTALAR